MPPEGYPTPHIKALHQQLVHTLGEGRVFAGQADQRAYACDASVLFPHPPELIVLPYTSEEVALTIACCHAHHIPFTARGAGTGQSGGALTPEGGVLIVLTRLNRILNIDIEKRHAFVEPGVVNATLTEACKPYGLFFAPDPSSLAACSLGGNVAENAGGIHCLKYGVTNDHLLGMEVILPTGEPVWLQRPEAEGVLGGGVDIDCTGLWCGSEGTLGVITKLQLALTPLPTHVGVALLGFDTTLEATTCIAEVMASRLLPAAMEFMDKLTVQAVNQAFGMGFPETLEALLLIELDAQDEASFTAQYATLQKLLNAHTPSLYAWETTPEACAYLWKARKGTVAAYGRFRPAMVVQDTVIPLEALPQVLAGIQAICERYGVLVGNVFHAGDGNLHPNILLNPQDPEETANVLKANDAIIALCLEAGGVLSGEHGIGIEKMAFMKDAFSPETLTSFERLKRTFDPDLRCNPGKLLPSLSKRCGESGCYHVDTQNPYGGIQLKGFPLPRVSHLPPNPSQPFLWI